MVTEQRLARKVASLFGFYTGVFVRAGFNCPTLGEGGTNQVVFHCPLPFVGNIFTRLFLQTWPWCGSSYSSRRRERLD